MKKLFMALFADYELRLYADTKEEARKSALSDFISRMEKEMKVCELKAKTERCVSCQKTYAPDEVSVVNGEQICVFCSWDKYGSDELSPEEIPF
jgi:hypothetical protein